MRDERVVILMADDDEDDRMLAREALEESRPDHALYFVSDGRELLDYLRHLGRYTDPARAPRPGVILLDLNMPRMDGRKALEVIKSDPDLRRIPVVIMTTSSADDDIAQSYDRGANSYITKPATFDDLVHVMRTLERYWTEVVELPSNA